MSKYFDVNTPRVGLGIVDQGIFNTEKLLDLPQRTRLDLAIMLSVCIV